MKEFRRIHQFPHRLHFEVADEVQFVDQHAASQHYQAYLHLELQKNQKHCDPEHLEDHSGDHYENLERSRLCLHHDG